MQDLENIILEYFPEATLVNRNLLCEGAYTFSFPVEDASRDEMEQCVRENCNQALNEQNSRNRYCKHYRMKKSGRNANWKGIRIELSFNNKN